MFRREASVLASLRHPGLARIYAAGDADGRPYLVLELLEGSSPITVSVGVAELQPGDGDVQTLIHRADLALYEAKRAGRSRVAVA